ncbi:MAG: YihY/virulence factor BrkB family protein [Chlorobi bacterium]|nr:YihY/virulence factor BrkB family protein [Chlorobiota bacterium]
MKWWKRLKYKFLGLYVRLKHRLKRIHVPLFPELSLYDILYFYSFGIIRGFLTMRASAIAYNFFMALFPFLLFVLSAIAFVPIEGFQENVIQFFHDVLPPKTHELFDGIIYDIATNRRKSILSAGILLSILFMANGVNAMLTGFESSVNKVLDYRKYYKKYAYALFISLILILILFVTLAGIIYFEIYILFNLKRHGVIEDISPWIYWTKRIFYFIMILLSISVIYKFGTEEGKKLPFISPGSILSSVVMLIGFYLYGLYIMNFNRYNQLYGSIGALLILQFMIYVYAIILLLGHELNMSIVKLKEKKGRPLSSARD